jgi:hypothetical protein
MVFWDVILYGLIKRYQNLEEPAASIFNIDCILSQKIVIIIFTPGRNSDFYNCHLTYDVYLMRHKENLICAPCNIIPLLLTGFSAIRFLILYEICDVEWLFWYKVYICNK